MEVSYYAKYGIIKHFSEQMLLSCDTQEIGCNGGNPARSMNWLRNNGGLTSEDEYPYTSGVTGETGSCISGYQSSSPPAAPLNVIGVKPKSDIHLEAAIQLSGVTILMIADSLVFQLYTGGLSTHPRVEVAVQIIVW